jgi:hypothetical protein
MKKVIIGVVVVGVLLMIGNYGRHLNAANTADTETMKTQAAEVCADGGGSTITECRCIIDVMWEKIGQDRLIEIGPHVSNMTRSELGIVQQAAEDCTAGAA